MQQEPANNYKALQIFDGQVDWPAYLRLYCYGLRRYVLREEDSPLLDNPDVVFDNLPRDGPRRKMRQKESVGPRERLTPCPTTLQTNHTGIVPDSGTKLTTWVVLIPLFIAIILGALTSVGVDELLRLAFISCASFSLLLLFVWAFCRWLRLHRDYGRYGNLLASANWVGSAVQSERDPTMTLCYGVSCALLQKGKSLCSIRLGEPGVWFCSARWIRCTIIYLCGPVFLDLALFVVYMLYPVLPCCMTRIQGHLQKCCHAGSF